MIHTCTVAWNTSVTLNCFLAWCRAWGTGHQPSWGSKPWRNWGHGKSMCHCCIVANHSLHSPSEATTSQGYDQSRYVEMWSTFLRKGHTVSRNVVQGPRVLYIPTKHFNIFHKDSTKNRRMSYTENVADFMAWTYYMVCFTNVQLSTCLLRNWVKVVPWYA